MQALSPKQEAFCLAFVECHNGTDAHVRAYPSAISRKRHGTAASDLLKKPNVAARIKELQSAHAERHECTVDDIAAQLDDDRTFARQAGNPSAAVSATMGKAKLLGMLTDKHDVNVTIRAEDAKQVILALFGKYADKLGAKL